MKAKLLNEYIDANSNPMQLINSTQFNPNDVANNDVTTVQHIYDMDYENLQLVVDCEILNYKSYINKYDIDDYDEEFAEYITEMGRKYPTTPFLHVYFYVKSQDRELDKYSVLSQEFNRNFASANVTAVMASIRDIISKFNTHSKFAFFNGIETEKDVQRKTRELIKNNFKQTGVYLTSRDKLYIYALKKHFNVKNVSRVGDNVVVELT